MGEFIIAKDHNKNWEEQKISEKISRLVPISSIEKYKFIPFAETGECIEVAVVDKDDINTENALDFFSRKLDKKIKLYEINEEVFNVLLRKVKNPKFEIDKAIEKYEEKEEAEEKVKKPRKKKEKVSIIQEAPVAKMVEVILKNAIDGNASDIHIEPIEDKVRVRYRVDGVLYSSIYLPKKVGPAIVSRVKILSNLKIDERRKPQDGRFRIEDIGKQIDFRVSTFPVAYGEKVVLRILDKSQGLIKLSNLGLEGRNIKTLKETIKEPYGIILVTGPTGSGKSTTLYSILKILNKEGVNIVTLEDPVEYMIEGVSQSQVKPQIDYTFASGLRSILRQDPDIIMVGEIRDSETAELAIHAALTGHLVLSTLHTNTAIGAVPRMIDMGVEPFLLSSSLRLVIGQRLVRKICPNCKKEKKEIPSPISEMIKRELSRVKKERLQESGILSKDGKADIKLFKGEGCAHCMRTGMKGRVGIYEVLEIDDKIVNLIETGKGEEGIEKAAYEYGFTKMKFDGIVKALKGITTIEEVQRVTEDESEEEVIQAKGEK